jgi:hypothetical protein
MSTDFYTGTNWEQSSGPLTVRAFQSNELWPAVADGKVALAAGDHPVLAVGDKSFRGDCLTGVVVTYDAVALIAQVNIADGFVVRQYVANVSGYTGTSPNAWNATIDIGDAVFVDDSPVLAARMSSWTATSVARTPRTPTQFRWPQRPRYTPSCVSCWSTILASRRKIR